MAATFSGEAMGFRKIWPLVSLSRLFPEWVTTLHTMILWGLKSLFCPKCTKIHTFPR